MQRAHCKLLFVVMSKCCTFLHKQVSRVLLLVPHLMQQMWCMMLCRHLIVHCLSGTKVAWHATDKIDGWHILTEPALIRHEPGLAGNGQQIALCNVKHHLRETVRCCHDKWSSHVEEAINGDCLSTAIMQHHCPSKKSAKEGSQLG